jgi:ABC-type lipoprotein export system ATPase subunit
MVPRTNESQPLVEVRDVFKIYRSAGKGPQDQGVETVALRGVSLTIQPSEFVAIQGPSGSGKSTLLSIMGGLDSASAGQVFFGNVEVGALPEVERAVLRRRQVGLVFQEANLIPFLTALENVTLPLRLARAQDPVGQARKWLERVGLGSRLNHRPPQLSGGEAQRVGIACALANRPALILADELTGELDSATSRQIIELLGQVNKQEGTAFVIVTHNEEVASCAQRVVHIEDGLLQEDGHPVFSHPRKERSHG